MKKLEIYLVKYWDVELYVTIGYTVDEELAKKYCRENKGCVYDEILEIKEILK